VNRTASSSSLSRRRAPSTATNSSACAKGSMTWVRRFATRHRPTRS
jgi:hypothetical protein